MGARPKLTQKRRTQMLEAAMEVIAERVFARRASPMWRIGLV